ncbi:nipped-B-like protein [Callorhinchus milii]|uniref:nipped-B-like protein n=1 Tax=Callorhinchus milii TaxID=7868 RepID=UPI001C3F6CB9|nr:nipped-B-like protein [Callorhinchus milii]
MEALLSRLPPDSTPLMEFVNASQGILLLLVVKQHLKNLYGFSDSKIQKYSPSESAKVYDKAVNRKSGVHFHPRQTLEFLKNGIGQAEITEPVKRNIVKQYLDVSNCASKSITSNYSTVLAAIRSADYQFLPLQTTC